MAAPKLDALLQSENEKAKAVRVEAVIFSPFVLIFLHASLCPALCIHSDPSLALHAGSSGLMHKALVFGIKDCRFGSCQDQVLLSAIHWPCIS